MKVDPPGSTRSAAVRRSGRAGYANGGAFAQALEGEKPAAAVGRGGAAGVVDALLALQEVPDAMAGRRRACRRGEELLDLLEDLRFAILLGTLSRDRLERLSVLLGAQRETVNEPRLAEVLAEIELRAAVELAKFQV
jgi:hypothetical protein